MLIYRLNRCFDECGCVRIRSCRSRRSPIMGLSFDSEKELLLVAFCDCVAAVDPCTGEICAELETCGRLNTAVLSVPPCFITASLEKDRQYVTVYRRDGKPVEECCFSEKYIIRDLTENPSECSRGREWALLILAEDRFGHPFLLKYRLGCADPCRNPCREEQPCRDVCREKDCDCASRGGQPGEPWPWEKKEPRRECRRECGCGRMYDGREPVRKQSTCRTGGAYGDSGWGSASDGMRNGYGRGARYEDAAPTDEQRYTDGWESSSKSDYDRGRDDVTPFEAYGNAPQYQDGTRQNPTEDYRPHEGYTGYPSSGVGADIVQACDRCADSAMWLRQVYENGGHADGAELALVLESLMSLLEGIRVEAAV